MEGIKSFLKLDESNVWKSVDIKKEPTERIKRIYNTIKKEIKDEIEIQAVVENKQTENVFPEKTLEEKGLIMTGTAISELLIKENKHKTKEFVFYIANKNFGYKKDQLPNESPLLTLEEILIKQYNENLRTGGVNPFSNIVNVIEFKREIDGELLSIKLYVVNTLKVKSDYAFCECFYNGDTIVATVRALRDIKNKQITITSFSSPRNLYYQMKEYAELYNLTPSPVETHILIRYIASHKIINMGYIKQDKSNCYTKEREEEFEIEMQKANQIHNIYTRHLQREISSTAPINSYFLEKARRMVELGIDEKDVLKKFEINMPEWNLDEKEEEIYGLIKYKMVEEIKSYNKKKKLSLLYSEDDKNKTEWLKAIDYEIRGMLKEIGHELNSMDREKLRFKLYLDEEFAESEKTIIDEKDYNSDFGSKSEAKRMAAKKKMLFGINGFFLYRQIANHVVKKANERNLVIPLCGEMNAGILFFEDGTHRDISKYNYLNKKRLEILQKKLDPFFQKEEN